MDIQWVPYPEGIHRAKKIKMHFTNGMPMHADILSSEMPGCILCSVRVPPNLRGFHESRDITLTSSKILFLRRIY